MKLKFILDKKYDLEMVYGMFKKNSAKLDWLAKKMEIDLELVREIKKSKREKSIKLLNKIVNSKYRILFPYLKKTLPLYQESWDEINKEFFKRTKKITGYPWQYKVYFCVVSPFHLGVSSWGGNKIIRTWRENPYIMRKITAHELLISHIFTILNRNFKKENLTTQQKWALSEISAWAITGLEKELLKFWPWITEEEKYPLAHNYPELYKLQKILRPKYEEKKNFKDFLKKSIKIIKRNEKILSR